MFEFHCEGCEHTFDKIIKRSESDEPVDCPECGEDAKREEGMYGDHMIKYNSDGFHRTDYQNKNSQ
jgi:putative FmdB family regulatory protein